MENTSEIAKIVYEIENLSYQGRDIGFINKIIEKKKENGEFPINLELNDIMVSETGICGVAFKDRNTDEIIVGFAGTNKDTSLSEWGKDLKADAKIMFDGLNPNGEYLLEANDFIKRLKDKGLNVTQVTGHSLGGAISVLVGMNNDIPLVVTYNGAPLAVPISEVLEIPEWGKLANRPTNVIKTQKEYLEEIECLLQIKELEKTYDGKIIRFVTSEDILNKLADTFYSVYIGEEIKLTNGKGHDMNFFLEDVEQKFIEEIIRAKKGELKIPNSIDFNNDKKPDFIFDSKQVVVKNLLSNGGVGGSIKVNVDSLKMLSRNLYNMAINDVKWIESGISLCINKNESVKCNNVTRKLELKCSVVDELKNAELNKLLMGIDNSHGELTSGEKRNVIVELKNFNTYSITRKFDKWGESGSCKWYSKGDKFDEGDLIKWVKTIKFKADDLLSELNEVSEYKGYGYANEITYKYDTISDIGKAYVGITNKFLDKTEKVFKGTGLRSGKNDGVVDALTEILLVERKNMEEIRKKLYSFAMSAEEISNKFTLVDKALSENTQIIQENKIEESYEVYLEKHSILDDVKGIVSAWDNQVEEASERLAYELIEAYDEVLIRTYNKFKRISSKIGLFSESIDNLNKIMNDTLVLEKNEKKYNQGAIRDIFPKEFTSNISYARKNIVPCLEVFSQTMNIAEVYKENICDFKMYFKNIIKEAVYNSMELQEIIHVQNAIMVVLNRMKTEINNVASQIESECEGRTFESYSEELKKGTIIFGHLEEMINECFGGIGI